MKVICSKHGVVEACNPSPLPQVNRVWARGSCGHEGVFRVVNGEGYWKLRRTVKIDEDLKPIRFDLIDEFLVTLSEAKAMTEAKPRITRKIREMLRTVR